MLEALDEHHPDCVLLDLNLRGFSGVGAYRLLRTDERYALLPVIVVSARPDARELLSGVGGVDGFVTKPFNVNTLADLVAERIASAARLREETASDPNTGLLGQDYVEARLADELTVVAPDGPAAFALVRLLSARRSPPRSAPTARLRRPGARAPGPRAAPDDAALGLTHTDELTVLLPGCTADQAVDLLQEAARTIEQVQLPGGAEVDDPVGGRAWPPTPSTPSDADELYMAADAALADAVDRGHRSPSRSDAPLRPRAPRSRRSSTLSSRPVRAVAA